MIIRILIERNICFSVMKSYSSLKKSNGERNSEYEVLALMEDYKELEEFGFETNQNTSECPINWLNPDGVISKIMTNREIKEFKILQSEFTEVFRHPENGIVYEINRQSFKEIYLKNNHN